jgi:NifU-like protein involved in Fe-S cluster formation
MSNALYSDAIKQLARAQQAQTPLTQIDAETTLDNPLCGDRITVHLTLKQ